MFVLCFLLCILAVGNARTAKRLYDDLDGFMDPYPFCGHRPIHDLFKSYLGKRNLNKFPKRVVGGQESKPGSWPWQVSLYYKGKQFCAGSLVQKSWIVTAAHCFHDSYSSTKPQDWQATLGDHKLNETDEFSHIRNISDINLHPRYDFPYFRGINDTPPDYDVAVVRLSRPAHITNYVKPICLPLSGQTFKPGKTCYLTGWGHTSFNGSQPNVLHEAKVKLVSRKTCNKKISYNGKIHNRSICAGFEKGGVDACQFDSGGPLSCGVDYQYFLTGVVSWGLGCAQPHKYGVYTNMVELKPWVVKTITLIEKNHIFNQHN